MAVTELTAALASMQFITGSLGSEDLYDEKNVSSSDSGILTATASGDPIKGTYHFTAVRTAQSQQLLSSAFKDDTDPLGGGKLSFRFGDHLERSAELNLFGGGEGISRGMINITDRSGATARIDLTKALTVDDVLKAINDNYDINVTATAVGDRLRLTDNTGKTDSNLIVEDIGRGTTAQSLGLGGINTAETVVDGQDMLSLFEDIDLDALNDGRGIRIDDVLDDISYELRDGTTGTIDLSPIIEGSAEVDRERSLGDIMEVINAAEPDKLRVEIAPDGDRLMVTDLTAGSGTFSFSDFGEGHVLEDLGLARESVDGVIIGGRILAGAKTVLTSSLDGGNGFGQLGTLELTDRSGLSDTVDLSDAETLQEIIETINHADVGITAQINAAKNGIELVDTTGMSASHMIVANGDAETATAEKLGIAIDADVTSVGSGDLHLQVISANTALSSLNGGDGVSKGSMTITDSFGRHAELDLRKSGMDTIADVITEINRLGIGVLAEINATGDGIRLTDTAGGASTLTVTENGSTAAKDLHLLGEAQTVDVDGTPTQIIDGSMTYVIELEETDSLEDLRAKINDLDAGVTAMTFVDGSSKPFRLVLGSERTGTAGAMLFDTSQLGFSLTESVRAEDALLVFGQSDTPANSILVSSSSNKFDSVLPGVKLTINSASDRLVSVNVTTSDSGLVANVRTMVENYNSFRGKLDELTAYNPETEVGSILTGSAAALRLDSELSYFLSGRFGGAGAIKSLGEVGVGMKDDGTLELDEFVLRSRFRDDPQAVQDFFTTETYGMSDKFDRLIETLSGEDSSLLTNRIETLATRIENNETRIANMDEQLESQQDRLYLEFYRMEIAIGKMQAGLSAIEALQPVPPIVSTRN